MAAKRLKLRLVIPSKKGLNQQIADQIKKKVSSGEILPSERLPSEQELADELNVSRDVVRRAYNLLKENGIAETPSRQHGTFIKPKS